MEMVLQQQRGSSSAAVGATTMKREEEEEGELRRGPWTVDEDLTLVNYIAEHGDGRWNALARAAGLKRTGKSCRLRWLNYLRPDVKRGDFTADEQLLILDLHSRWGNRWSKIAQQLPGRTDNEIKNYWRTRVQKHARQLGCDVNSRRFKDAMTYLWMPRLAERAAAVSQQPLLAGNSNDTAAASASPCLSALTTTTTTPRAACLADNSYYHSPDGGSSSCVVPSSSSSDSSLTSTESTAAHHLPHGGGWMTTTTMQSGVDDEFWSAAVRDLTTMANDNSHQFQEDLSGWVQGFSEGISDADHSLWSLDDIWRMQWK